MFKFLLWACICCSVNELGTKSENQFPLQRATLWTWKTLLWPRLLEPSLLLARGAAVKEQARPKATAISHGVDDPHLLWEHVGTWVGTRETIGKKKHVRLKDQIDTSRTHQVYTHVKSKCKCINMSKYLVNVDLCKSLSSFRSWGCTAGLATAALCLVSLQWQAKPHELGLVEIPVEKEADQVGGPKWHIQVSHFQNKCQRCQVSKYLLKVDLCKSRSSMPFRSWGCIDGLATAALWLVSCATMASKATWVGTCRETSGKSNRSGCRAKVTPPGLIRSTHIYITSTCKMCQDVKIACKCLPLQITVLFPILGLGLHPWAFNCSPLACLLVTVASKATWVGTCWRAKVAHPDLHTWRKSMQDVSSTKIPCQCWPLQITVLCAIPILGLYRWACNCSPLACLLATMASKATWVGTCRETSGKRNRSGCRAQVTPPGLISSTHTHIYIYISQVLAKCVKMSK